MTWARRFRLRESLLESLWLIPLVGAVLGGILGIVLSFADEHLGAPSLWRVLAVDREHGPVLDHRRDGRPHRASSSP